MRTSLKYQPTRLRRGLTLLELVMVVAILAILTALVVPGMTEQGEQTRRTAALATMQELRDVIANRYVQDMQALPQPDLVNLYDGSGRIPAVTGRQVDGSTTGALPQMHFLFVNPNQYGSSGGTSATAFYAAVNDYDSQARIGWNGPYFMPKLAAITTTTTGTVGTNGTITTMMYPNPDNARFPTNPNNTQKWSDYGFTTTFGQPGDFSVNDPWGSPYVIVIRNMTHGSTLMYTANVVSAGFNRKLETTADATAATGDDLVLAIKSWK